ncbi:hypothetical protein Sinme_1267 [Sinorhizobium meliloti AK83]|nr:hypothetical protein Sinme_1267 [Sinorhizobium meliloti AK83]
MHGRCRNLVWGLRAISFRTAYEKYSEGPGPSLPSSLCSSQGSSSAASAARKSLSSPMTWPGWIPVTGTGMREAGMHGRCRNLVWGLRAISFRTAYEKYSEGPGPSPPSSLCSSQG